MLTGKKTLENIERLKITPAWTDVWICEDNKGHLQATGVDKKGRKQYVYHPLWTKLRSAAKFDKMVEFGHILPVIRRQYDLDLRVEGNSRQMMMPKERMLAALVRLLDTTFIRIGNETYREANQHYGLTTLLDDHCTFEYDDNVLPDEEKWYDGQLVGWFTFVGKSGKDYTVMVHDERYPDLLALPGTGPLALMMTVKGASPSAAAGGASNASASASASRAAERVEPDAICGRPARGINSRQRSARRHATAVPASLRTPAAGRRRGCNCGVRVCER